jgi:alpha-L-fucosidase
MKNRNKMFKPTSSSLKTHKVPDWFHDAKLGIFIHWGLYSVGGWAVPQKGLDGLPQSHIESPYAEWYQNMQRIKESPVAKYHRETYGPDSTYDDFAPIFKKESEKMDAGSWAEFIKKSGARYTVLTTKHHDGFTLWPSKYPNPRKSGWGTDRDLVGNVAKAVREKGIRFGAYYSGILDWTFQPNAIYDFYDEVLNGVSSLKYAKYCSNQFLELIDRYQPDILWNDIGYPLFGGLNKVLAYYYNTVPEGVANNRWHSWWIPGNVRLYPVTRKIFDLAVAMSSSLRKMLVFEDELKKIQTGDYATPEFEGFDEKTEQKWETTRGLGSSFGYNQNEDESNVLSGNELIRLFVDIVSKNGNLLINIGPKADGTIPEYQQKPILALGKWLEKNGEAIYGTRPWIKSQSDTEEGNSVRFTCKGADLFVFLMNPSNSRIATIKELQYKENSSIIFLEDGSEISWKTKDNSLELDLSRLPETQTVRVFKVNLKNII